MSCADTGAPEDERNDRSSPRSARAGAGSVPEPAETQRESVWDYPRPPVVEQSSQLAEVHCAGRVIASSRQTRRVLETSHPPVHYFRPQDVDLQLLLGNRHRSFCEWKGVAHYFDLLIDERLQARAAWCYPEPSKRFADLKGWVAFYPSRVDRCTLDGEVVQAQPGDFYGGWITSQLIGPFKGAPGTQGW